MYTSVNDDLIFFDFNPSVKVRVFGDDLFYLVELFEYKKNHHSPLLVQSFPIQPSGQGIQDQFFCPIEFKSDFEIRVNKFLPNIGIKQIFTHRFNEAGKLVKFNLYTDNLDEALLWYQRILEYQKLNQCEIFVESRFSEIYNLNKRKYDVQGLSFYKTYNLGRFPKSSKDFKTIHTSEHGVIRYGYWKFFWSYEHPRDFTKLSSQEIADDILGLSK